jgi:hypothetical protein
VPAPCGLETFLYLTSHQTDATERRKKEQVNVAEIGTLISFGGRPKAQATVVAAQKRSASVIIMVGTEGW